MISLPYELEQQVIRHETIRDDAADAREVLETLLLIQLRAIADGLLANMLLRGESFDAPAWWYQFLSRQPHPSKYLPDFADVEFRSYRKDFAQRVATNQIKKVSLRNLPELQIRILGGHCHFYDEGKINRQLVRLGSSLRLIVVGSSHYRIARMRNMLGQQSNDKASLDGRFILGRIGPASFFDNAALYLFEREFAISPYMEAQASGFTDKAKIVVRQDVLRGEVENQIQIFRAEKARAAGSNEATEKSIPLTDAHEMVGDMLEREDGSERDMEELLYEMMISVLTHESRHIMFAGSLISATTSEAAAWRQIVREDLLRFAQQPHTFVEFRTAFADYFPGSGLTMLTSPAFSDGNYRYNIQRTLEMLLSDGLLFVDRDNRFYSKLYGRGEKWTL